MLVCDSATVVVVGGGGKKFWLVVSSTELTLAGLQRELSLIVPSLI